MNLVSFLTVLGTTRGPWRRLSSRSVIVRRFVLPFANGRFTLQGALRYEEIVILVVFATVILAWIFRGGCKLRLFQADFWQIFLSEDGLSSSRFVPCFFFEDVSMWWHFRAIVVVMGTMKRVPLGRLTSMIWLLLSSAPWSFSSGLLGLYILLVAHWYFIDNIAWHTVSNVHVTPSALDRLTISPWVIQTLQSLTGKREFHLSNFSLLTLQGWAKNGLGNSLPLWRRICPLCWFHCFWFLCKLFSVCIWYIQHIHFKISVVGCACGTALKLKKPIIVGLDRRTSCWPGIWPSQVGGRFCCWYV